MASHTTSATARGRGRSPSACENPLCSCDPCGCTNCKCGVAKLSKLERAVMERIWQSTEADVTVRAVADELPRYAYTTVATVLDRLVTKGVLRSRLVKNTKRYTPVGSRGAHTAVLMHDALAGDADPDAALRRFAASLTEDQVATLREALRASIGGS
jgi:predicted transcriptional regulator